MLTDAHFLAVAYIVADAGTCSRLQVGAVLVKDRRIVSTGYNGAAAGVPHCIHEMIHPDGTMSYVGTNLEGCILAVHAEVNAIAYAARHGISTDGSTMYVTDSPCRACAKLMINAGVREVKYGRQYRDTGGLDELAQAGIRVEELGEPELHLVSVASGHGEGVHSGKHSDKAFEEGWSAASAARRGRSSGLQ